jgi:hypothetical protein
VVDVERRHLVAERAEKVPEAGRVGPAGNQRHDLTPGRDQLVAADVLLNPNT